jgi:hypothetical protein
MVSIVNEKVRFPESRIYVYRYSDQIKVAINNILAATDTKNRIVEVADGSAPSTQVELNSVRRTDDATVAVRTAIETLIDLIILKVGFYDRTEFESRFGLTWVTPDSNLGNNNKVVINDVNNSKPATTTSTTKTGSTGHPD